MKVEFGGQVSPEKALQALFLIELFLKLSEEDRASVISLTTDLSSHE